MCNRRAAWLAVHLCRGLIALVMAFSVGCATAPVGREDLLGFIQEGVSTREEVILQLGDPNALYEDSRILTYRLSRDEKGWILRDATKGWYGVLVNLVLVFDDRGVLRRHSLVQVRLQ